MNHPMPGIRRFRGLSTCAALLLFAIAGRSALAQTSVSSPPGTATTAISAPTQDIREIRGPKPIPSAWLWPLIALSSLFSAGAVWGAWKWYRRRPGLFLQTPVEIALARLEYARGLMSPELGRDFSIEVSSVVREYIESRFHVMAAHLTTREFLHDVLDSKDPVLAASQSLLAEFLEACDLAKFGGWNLSIHDMETLLQGARRFIVESAAPTGEPSAAPGPDIPPPNPSLRGAVRETSPSTPREAYDSLPST
jgi:hypothetical protein